MNLEEHKKLWQLVENIDVTMLSSLDGNTIRSRPMMVIQNEYNGTLWFFTRLSSHKAQELKQHTEVGLSFCDIKNETFVSVSGTASLIQDKEKIQSLWNQMIELWFPEGKDSDDIALLAVNVHQAEYWDAHNKVRQIFELVSAKVKSEQPAIGEHEYLGSD